MFALISISLSVVAFAADSFYFYLTRHQPIRWRKARIAGAALTDSLPLIMMIGAEVVVDNPSWVMKALMWMLWLWMITVGPRLAYYFLRVIGFPRTGMVAGACIAAILLWGVTWGRTRLHTAQVEICSDRLPASFNGFRIVQLSDVHIGTMIRPAAELRRIAERIASLRPDVVIFTGDLINVRPEEITPRLAKILAGIEAPGGVVSVTGNHDIGAYIKDTITFPRDGCLEGLIAAQQAIGWRVLNDSTIYLKRGGDSISLSGIAYDTRLWWRRHDRILPPARLAETYRGVPDSLFNITAVHLPQLWEQILDTPYGDLTLSGHTHSLQAKIRLFGASYSPARYVYDRWSGRYDEQERTLYINDGTGYVGYPMRLGAWPEITLITLKRCE